MAIYLNLMLTFYLLYDQDAVSAVVCWQFSDHLISPSHTDGVKPIFTPLTLYHKTNGSFGFKHTILVPFAFATWSLVLLALRCLKLLRSFWDNPSPAPSPNEQGINRNIGFQYHGPFATFVVFLQWHLLRFLACGFCDDTYTDLIVAYPLWRLRAWQIFSLWWCRISTSRRVRNSQMVSDLTAITTPWPSQTDSCLRCDASRLNPLLYTAVRECEYRSLSSSTFEQCEILAKSWDSLSNFSKFVT